MRRVLQAPRMSRRPLRLASAVLLVSVASAMGAAQTRAVPAPSRGIELELHGTRHVIAGRTLVVRGVAYSVANVADLHPLGGAEVTARLYITRENEARIEPVPVTVRADSAGRFALESPVPLINAVDATLRIDVRDAQSSRRFEREVSIEAPYITALDTDRVLYEPGETLHALVRVRESGSEAPVTGRRVRVRVVSSRNDAEVIATAESVLSRLGAASFDVPLDADAGDRQLSVVVDSVDPGVALRATTNVRVGRRSLERMNVTARFEHDVVAPSETVRGTAVVRAASGAPIAGARVEITHDGATLVVITGHDGVARFEWSAPVMMSRGVQYAWANIRAVHPGAGSARTNASYLVASAPFQIESRVANGGLVPEIDSPLYALVTDPRGRPVGAGTVVRARGRIVAHGGVTEARTDANGVAVLWMHAMPEAYATHADGDCADHTAATIDLEVIARESFATRTCVPVAANAQLRVEAVESLRTPGQALQVRVFRRNAVRHRPIAIDVLDERSVAASPTVLFSTVVPADRDAIDVPVPARAIGVLRVRARPVLASGVAEGTGSVDAVLVRPAHAFDLRLVSEHRQYHPRDTARVFAETPAGITDGAIALVVRDLAAHAGEHAFVRYWLDAMLSREIVSPSRTRGDLLLRATLAQLVAEDETPVSPAPLVPTDGSDAERYSESDSSLRGDMRDPFARRDDFLRRGLAPAMRALETGIETDLAQGTDVVIERAGGRTTFAHDAIESLVAAELLGENDARTLGDAPLTAALIENAHLGFDFDHAARRVARARLVRLLAALVAPVDPGGDEPSPLAGDPPDRWLSRLVSWGTIPQSALRDPWGGSFVFRRTQGRTAALSLGTRAVGWELASAGPDHVFGTADDVRDPFERVVTAATPYAIASGEDELMTRLSTLDPAGTALHEMVLAYQRVGAGVREEEIGDVVTADGSEGGGTGEGGLGLGGIGTIGHGSGYGSGAGYGSGRGSVSTTGSLAQLASLLRERFPATLMFVGERAIDPSGRTQFDVTLADALTTFRIEAIAWTAEGWTTSASTELQVDQDVVVDAPIPPLATPGDSMRIPVRVANRSSTMQHVRVAIEPESSLAVHAGAAQTIDVGPGEAAEAIVVLDVQRASRGRVTIAATDAQSGARLDAVRRPMEVLAEARPSTVSVDALVDRRASFVVSVPREAAYRADGVVRIAAGPALGDDPNAWGPLAPDRSWPAWAQAMAGTPVSEALLARGQLAIPGGGAAQWARAIGARWNDTTVTDEAMHRGLERVTALLEPAPTRASTAASTVAADVLLGLLPAIAHIESRAAEGDALRALVTRLRRAVESETAHLSDDPAGFARAAFVLRASSRTHSTRADEFERRATRAVQHHDGGSFLEGAAPGIEERVVASSVLALALLQNGDRAGAFAFVREAASREVVGHLRDDASRALLHVLLARLTAGAENASSSTATVRIDGASTTVPLRNGVGHVSSAVLSQPGEHHIDVDLGAPMVLLATASSRFGLPWNSSEPVRAPLELTLDGDPGARDTRSAFWLRVRNRGPRVLAHPFVRIALPAGAELDDESRRELQSRLGGASPVLEERTLVLAVRALAPGASVRLPLRLRWSIGGALHGLGIVANVDDAGHGATAIVLPRVVTLPDHGREPELPARR